MDSDKSESITEAVLGAVFEVSNTLGPGFPEKVYERALVREWALRGLRAEAQVPICVSYKGESVGSYFADIVVEDRIVLELKCADRLVDQHMAQCMNYLIASGRNVCLLINFQKAKGEWKRIVLRF